MTDKRYTADELRRLSGAFQPTSQISEALRQAAEDCENAERYRWLRDKAGLELCVRRDCADAMFGKELDREVDTARTQEKAND